MLGCQQGREDDRSLLVNRLKAELAHLRQGQLELRSVDQEIERLAGRLQILEEDSVTICRDSAYKQKQMHAMADQIRKEIAGFKLQAQQSTDSVQNLAAQNEKLRREIEEAEGALRQLTAVQGQNKGDQESSSKEANSLNLRLQQIRLERGLIEQQCEKKCEVLQNRLIELKKINREYEQLQEADRQLGEQVAKAEAQAAKHKASSGEELARLKASKDTIGRVEEEVQSEQDQLARLEDMIARQEAQNQHYKNLLRRELLQIEGLQRKQEVRRGELQTQERELLDLQDREQLLKGRVLEQYQENELLRSEVERLGCRVLRGQ